MFLAYVLRQASFLANEYLRAHGPPALLDGCTDDQSLFDVADRHVNAAAGRLDVHGLVGGDPAVKTRQHPGTEHGF